MLHNFKWGQVSILLTFCVIAAFVAHRKNMFITAGILLALAAAIKYYTFFFIFYFIVRRDKRTSAVFAFSFIFFYVIVPCAGLGPAGWFAFEKATMMSLSQANWVPYDVNSQYVAHVAVRISWILWHFENDLLIGQLATYLGYIFALSSLAMAWILGRRPSTDGPALAMVAIFTALPFVIKTSWPHYFVYLPVGQTAVFLYLLSGWRGTGSIRRLCLTLPVVSMIFSSVFFFNLFPDWTAYNAYGWLFFSNLILLVSIYGIGFAKLLHPDSSINPTPH